MSVLTGPAIREAFIAKDIEIDPFDPRQINPTSYDLRLGKQLRMYCPVGREKEFVELAIRGYGLPSVKLDAAKPNNTVLFDIPPEGIELQPGNFYLGHTLERVATRKYQPSVEGKSSIARLTIEVHLTAGWGEPGFDGQYTLEMGCRLPVTIYAGMCICQIKFETLEGEFIDYKNAGNYVGVNAEGPVASRSFMQFAANAK